MAFPLIVTGITLYNLQRNLELEKRNKISKRSYESRVIRSFELPEQGKKTVGDRTIYSADLREMATHKYNKRVNYSNTQFNTVRIPLGHPTAHPEKNHNIHYEALKYH